MEKRLGKLVKPKFGICGYQDAMLGFSATITGNDGWGVGCNFSAWDANKIECSEYAQWTEEDRSKQYDDIMRYISDLLHKAKVTSVDQLDGIPVEATFDGNMLKEWRILEEVL